MRNNYNIVHEFCGHGTGSLIHMPPLVCALLCYCVFCLVTEHCVTDYPPCCRR